MIKTVFKTLVVAALFVITNPTFAISNYHVQHKAQPWALSAGRQEWYWTPAYEPASSLLRLDTTPTSCQPVSVAYGSLLEFDKTYILRVCFIYGFRDYNQHWLLNYTPHAFGVASAWDTERGDWVERFLPTPSFANYLGDNNWEYIVGCDYKIRATLDPTSGEVILTAFLLNTAYGWKSDAPDGTPPLYTIQEIENALGQPCIVGGW